MHYAGRATSNKPVRVDMRSDTVTRPTDGMRAAMMAAEVGDDVYGDDPTVNACRKKRQRFLARRRRFFFPAVRRRTPLRNDGALPAWRRNSHGK